MGDIILYMICGAVLATPLLVWFGMAIGREQARSQQDEFDWDDYAGQLKDDEEVDH